MNTLFSGTYGNESNDENRGAQNDDRAQTRRHGESVPWRTGQGGRVVASCS